MPGICRVQQDRHIGHARPRSPYHQTPYVTGSPNVSVNGTAAVRVGDNTACLDVALGGSSTVFVNGIPVHRQNDATTGHDGFVPNKAAAGSPNVNAGG